MPEAGTTPRRLSLEELRVEAERLWASLAPGSVVWLTGELGTGKTAFAKALGQAAGARSVRSPTFALVHEYSSPRGLLIHVDCYRLRSPDEALDLDFPELAHRARLMVIEWPERAGAFAPPPDAHLAFGHVDDPEHRSVERLR